MDKQKLQDGIEIHRSHLIKFPPSPKENDKEDAEKQYQLMTLARSRMNEDIAQLKADEHRIHRKLMWFSEHDQYIQRTTQEIKNLESYLHLHPPPNFAPRRTGSIRLPEKDAPTSIRPDRKRCQKRAIKKGRVNTEYTQQVQEELISSKKSGGMTSSGTQQLTDMMESMAQRIRHGSKNRADEMRMYHETMKVKETREIYTGPEPEPPRKWYSREIKSKRDVDWKRSVQHTINIRFGDIEAMKMDVKGRKARVTRLKAELELVRKKMSCLKKELEDVNAKRCKAYKRACELREQLKNEL